MVIYRYIIMYMYAELAGSGHHYKQRAKYQVETEFREPIGLWVVMDQMKDNQT